MVCVTKMDRITRSVRDFFELWETFKEHKIEFVSLMEDFDTTTAMGRAMIAITMVFAQLERETTSERTRDKIAARREAGLWHGGSVPLGFKSHPTNKTTLEIDEPNAELVRKDFFERYLKVGTARGLVRYLSENGIKRPKRKSIRGNEMGGSDFTVQSVIDLLSNKAYVAKRELEEGEVIACSWPALIDQDLFDRVQARLAANSESKPTGRKSLDHVYLLEGILFCGTCGSAMTRSVANGAGGRYYYYKCSKKHRTAGVCKVRDVPADVLEKFVLGQVRSFSLDSEAVRNAVSLANAGRDKALAEVQEELGKKQSAYLQASKAVSKLVDAFEAEEDTAALSSIRSRLKERESAQNQLKIDVADLEAKARMLRQDMMDTLAVTESYSKLSFLFDESERLGARQELKNLLNHLIGGIDWIQNPEDPKRGEALIKLLDLPAEFGLLQQPEKEQRDELVNSSSRCQEWLPSVDSNHGPAD